PAMHRRRRHRAATKVAKIVESAAHPAPVSPNVFSAGGVETTQTIACVGVGAGVSVGVPVGVGVRSGSWFRHWHQLDRRPGVPADHRSAFSSRLPSLSKSRLLAVFPVPSRYSRDAPR